LIEPALQEALESHRRGDLPAAERLYRAALARRPDDPVCLGNLGKLLADQGRVDEGIAAYEQALRAAPHLAALHYNLGMALRSRGDWAAAEARYRRALELSPGLVAAYNNLGNVVQAQGRGEEAAALYREGLRRNPGDAVAHNNLGNVHKAAGRVDEALACYGEALRLAPGFAEAWSNRADACFLTGRLDEALECGRRAMQLAPANAIIHSNFVFMAHFHPAFDAGKLGEVLRDWREQHAAALQAEIPPRANDRSPDRRLRVGYVSPDFRDQAESFFTVPLLANHDHAGFEVYCYSSVLRPDHVTARLRQCADVWRDVGGTSDEALAAIIREDRIDILVDLTMHMAGNRALVFARQPAPVQVCWLAYPGSTGLETMDYRLTDSFMDPPDADTSCYAEQSIRLPDCWVIYDPLIDLPPRPPEQTGPITFGSLNNPAKLNDPLLTLWARVLQAVPGSRLMLLVLSLEQRQRIGRLMESLGVASERLQFAGRMDRPQYLRCYDQIDIALDPLPYNGITTTCDALYMGVPVLTLAGQTAAGRAGKAMLSTIGLAELVAHTQDEFVRKAAQLAADLPRLIEMRRGLRARLAASPLMDAPRFAHHVEAAYRQMWRQWCAQ